MLQVDADPRPGRVAPAHGVDENIGGFEVRRCLGMAFALYEMKIVLARLLSSVELELADAGPIRPVTRGFFIAPGKGLRVRVKARGAATAAV